MAARATAAGGVIVAGPMPRGALPAGAAAYWRRRVLARLPLALGLGLLLAALALAAVERLPLVYGAQAQLTIAPAQIALTPPQVEDRLGVPATPPVPAAEQLQLIERRVLTRANLLAIAERFAPLPNQDAMGPEEIAAAMQRATRAEVSAGRDQAPLLVVSFHARRPDLARAVVGELLRLMVQSDRGQRLAQAQAAVALLRPEAERAAADRAALAAELLDFRRAHAGALPDEAGAQRSELERLRQQLVALDARATALRQEGNTPPPPEAAGSTDAAPAAAPEPADERADRASALAEQRAALQDRIAPLAAALVEVAANGQALERLGRELAVLQERSRAASGRLAQAEQAAGIVALGQGERVSVVQEATPSADPRAARQRLALAGLAGGLVAGIGLAALVEAGDRRIRRGSDLERGLGITPLGVLPDLAAPRERIGRTLRGLVWTLMALAVAALVAHWLVGQAQAPAPAAAPATLQ